MKLIILFTCLVLCQSNGDEEHQKLQDLATKIMQNLQKEHIPSEGSNSGTPNAPINHLHGSALISKTDTTTVTVGVKGVQFVSVAANGKVVNITTTFGVGAVAVYKVDTDDTEEVEEYLIMTDAEAEKEVDNKLESMGEEYLSDNLEAKGNETKIILAKKAKLDMKIKPKGSEKKEVDVTVHQGYIVAAKTNVTRGYNNSFNF